MSSFGKHVSLFYQNTFLTAWAQASGFKPLGASSIKLFTTVLYPAVVSVTLFHFYPYPIFVSNVEPTRVEHRTRLLYDYMILPSAANIRLGQNLLLSPNALAYSGAVFILQSLP